MDTFVSCTSHVCLDNGLLMRQEIRGSGKFRENVRYGDKRVPVYFFVVSSGRSDDRALHVVALILKQRVLLKFWLIIKRKTEIINKKGSVMFGADLFEVFCLSQIFLLISEDVTCKNKSYKHFSWTAS